MAVKLLKHCGIVPDMLFTERSKICKYFNQHRFNGMLPPNLLERRIRIFNSGKPSPIQAGTDPKNLLFLKSTNFNKLQFFRGKGNSPKKLLLRKFKVCSWDKEPKKLGISPVKLLPAKFRLSSLRKCIKQLGRCLDKRLSERSRKFKIPPLIFQTDEAVPEKRFSAQDCHFRWENKKMQ